LPLAFKIARLFDRLIEDIFDPEEPEIAHRRPA
jgi:DNA-binding XRE family transcriptional regulator